MRLYYLAREGEQKAIDLTEKPVTIGRSADADILLLDEKASRVHCGIRFWDGEYFVKDLKSKNGTFVNETQVDPQEVHQLAVGDRIRVGTSIFVFDTEAPGPGANTALMEMQDAYEGGKGYSTILREIVDQTDEPPMTPIPMEPENMLTTPEGATGASGTAVTAGDSTPAQSKVRKKVIGAKKKVKPAAGLKRKPLKVTIKKKPPKDGE